MLSREIATTLGGRFMMRVVYPYDFSEYLMALGIDGSPRKQLTMKGKAAISSAFDAYLENGAFPELIDVQSKRMYLNNIYQTIYLGDIIARNGIGNEFAVRLLLKKIAESVCHPLSYSRLTRIVTGSGLAIGKMTVIKYVSYMQDSYLIFSIQNIMGKLVDRETTPKYYFMDTGLLQLLVLDGVTAALENLAAIELVRRYGMDQVYYYERNIEVDFYIPEKKMAVQVCYFLHQSAETLAREVGGLLKLNDFMKGQSLYILTYSEEEEIERGGVTIHVLPMWKWLLAKEL